MEEVELMKKVLLVNWDSYPNITSGGVYSWEKLLVEQMPDIEFSVINFLSNPNANGKYVVPSNVASVINIPLFGSQRSEEYYGYSSGFFDKVGRTTDSVIKTEFNPVFSRFVAELLSNQSEPEKLYRVIFDLHTLFMSYDCRKCMENPIAWQTFLGAIESDKLYREMTLREALTAFQMIQRNMQILSLEPPVTDLVHCSLAWFPAMVALCAKIKNGTPILVTEHGVAFRELLLYYNAYLTDEPANVFWKQLSRNLVRTIYRAADCIAPVCYANAKWEADLGADISKIKVIYNGVDIEKFRPMEVARPTRPTVACIGRVDIFKDIINLIQAINIVKSAIPDVECLIYGSSTDLEYSIRCTDAVAALGLQDNVKFVGRVQNPELAYNTADVVVISSITEGFPFAIIEAMACGRAIVATDVGGIREALEGCGTLVRSNHPRELAAAIVSMLQDPEERKKLGSLAAKKAQEGFTLGQSIQRYKEEYERLVSLRPPSPIYKEARSA